jgi:hypothetical protein
MAQPPTDEPSDLYITDDAMFRTWGTAGDDDEPGKPSLLSAGDQQASFPREDSNESDASALEPPLHTSTQPQSPSTTPSPRSRSSSSIDLPHPANAGLETVPDEYSDPVPPPADYDNDVDFLDHLGRSQELPRGVSDHESSFDDGIDLSIPAPSRSREPDTIPEELRRHRPSTDTSLELVVDEDAGLLYDPETGRYFELVNKQE